MLKTNAVILAAGNGTRMKSSLPKVLCEVCMKPMILWVVDSCLHAGIDDVCTVLGDQAQPVLDILPKTDVCYQMARQGTAHAVLQALPFLERHRGEHTLVLMGDAPLMDAKTIQESRRFHELSQNAATVISAEIENPHGYGRIVHYNGMVRIVEETDADDAVKRVREINSGAYWFKTDALIEALPKISNDNAKKEYYLTDSLSVLSREGLKTGVYRAENTDVTLGANDLKGLLFLNEKATRDIIRQHIENGVEFTLTDGVIISPDCKIGTGTKILPGTILKGKTVVGKDCVLGPNAFICDSVIGEGVSVNASQVYDSVIGPEVKIGPFAHIRPNCEVARGVKLGAFIEAKNSSIGEGSSVSHLTYVGDSVVGKNVNFGCGCVTVNYNGMSKNRTTIGDNAFIGCNTNLIAPVTIGSGAYTAAGSTVTDDVPEKSLAIARSRQIIKENWAENKFKK